MLPHPTQWPTPSGLYLYIYILQPFPMGPLKIPGFEFQIYPQWRYDHGQVSIPL